jgi:hypothetical protein
MYINKMQLELRIKCIHHPSSFLVPQQYLRQTGLKKTMIIYYSEFWTEVIFQQEFDFVKICVQKEWNKMVYRDLG